MPRGPYFIQIMIDQHKYVYGSFGYLEIKLVETMVAISRLSNTCKSMVF
jgi:hypothetical protein